MQQTSSHFKRMIDKQGFIVLDGGVSTECEYKGADINDKLWSAKLIYQNPELIQQVHFEFYEAGADIGTTSTYQASIQGFIEKGFTLEQSKEMFTKSVELCESARNKFWEQQSQESVRIRPLVAASLGNYGAYLADGSEYHGDYKVSDDMVYEYHLQRIKLLPSSVDLLLFETIPNQKEAMIILTLLQQNNLKGIVSYSCRNGELINQGLPIKQCVEQIRELDKNDNLLAIGINCTAPQYISSLIEQVKNQGYQLMVYPNKGEQYNPVDKVFIEQQSDDWNWCQDNWRLLQDPSIPYFYCQIAVYLVSLILIYMFISDCSNLVVIQLQ